MLLFNGGGDCLAAKLRPGNVYSAEGWEELLLPEIERQQRMGKRVLTLLTSTPSIPSTRQLSIGE